MPGQGFSGLAGYNRFRTNLTPASYGYWDAYGAGILPGGNLRVSPGAQGQPRSMPGIEFPGTPDPGISNDPIYGNTLGLPGREVIAPGGGGMGEFGGGVYPRGPMAYPYPDMNIPTNENVNPRLNPQFYSNPISNPLPGVPASYPDLSAAPPVNVTDYSGAEVPGYGMNNVPFGQNYQGYQAPVARATAIQPGGFFKRLWGGLTGQPQGNFQYPVPGAGGFPSTFGGGQGWAQNAARGGFGGGFAGMANNVASNAGFGGGLTSLGSGGWQSVSELPSGLGSMSWQQALGGGFQHHIL